MLVQFFYVYIYVSCSGFLHSINACNLIAQSDTDFEIWCGNAWYTNTHTALLSLKWFSAIWFSCYLWSEVRVHICWLSVVADELLFRIFCVRRLLYFKLYSTWGSILNIVYSMQYQSIHSFYIWTKRFICLFLNFLSRCFISMHFVQLFGIVQHQLIPYFE